MLLDSFYKEVVAGGVIAAVLLPACVEALPVRRGECRSRSCTPHQGMGPWRQRRRRGCRKASVSSPAASVRPSFASLAAAAGLGWHRRAEMERRERSCGCVVYVVVCLVNKNDDSTVSITNTGCFRCDNQCRVPFDGKHFFFDLHRGHIGIRENHTGQID